MNLRASLKYQLYDCKKPVLIFYLVISALLVLIFTAHRLFIDYYSGTTSMNGLEFGTAIFIFIVGLNSFKETFRMFLQNGVSRRTLFISQILAGLTVSAVITVISTLFVVIGKLLASGSDRFFFYSLIEMIYTDRYAAEIINMQMLLESLPFFTIMLATALMAGYFITVLYYRLNKGGKIAVSVGVPVFLFILLPIFDTVFGGLSIFTVYLKVLLSVSDFYLINPYCGMLIYALIFVLFSGLSWLLMRKAVAKN